MKRRKTEIHMETREVVVFRHRNNVSIWCDECGSQVKALKPEAAAAALRISLRALFRQLEAGRLHACETRDGRLFLCGNSLLTEIRGGEYLNENP